MRDDVLASPRRQHQLKENPLLQLLDGIDDGTPFVPTNRPGRENSAGGEHVHSERDIADSSFPNRSALLFLLFLPSQKHSWLIGTRERS